LISFKEKIVPAAAEEGFEKKRPNYLERNFDASKGYPFIFDIIEALRTSLLNAAQQPKNVIPFTPGRTTLQAWHSGLFLERPALNRYEELGPPIRKATRRG
jgi:hypothetical protein